MTESIPNSVWGNEKCADDYKCATFAVDKEKWIQVYEGATFVAGEEKCVRVGEGATFVAGQEKCVRVDECATFGREIVSLVVSTVRGLSRHETIDGYDRHISALAFFGLILWRCDTMRVCK
uniref:Uncharacterized protein n=1 Tax=Panagrellus redivivus TaxID=6233 RepID=A0A7E4UQ44_PANRE